MRAVTAFVWCGGRVLLLCRSRSMPTQPGKWAGVSGIIEGEESPPLRALQEIREETGMVRIRLVFECTDVPVLIPTGVVRVRPFLACTGTTSVHLNSENTGYKWIRPADMIRYDTVPHLRDMLFGLFWIQALLDMYDADMRTAAHGTSADAVARMLAGAGVHVGFPFSV